MGGQRRVVVLGGGVSGLTCSYYLNMFKKSVLTVAGAQLPQVTLLEKGNELGGWMKSHRDPSTGAVFQYGPRSLRAVGYESRSSMALAEELGLSDQVVAVKSTSPAAKQRLIYSQAKLHPLPSNVLGFFRKLPFLNHQSLAGVFFREMRRPASAELRDVDESIHSFVSRRFGSEVADYLADPFIRGVIAGDVRTTSVKAILPRIKATEDKYGSIVLNYRKVPELASGVVKESVLCRKAKDEHWAMWNFDSGLGALPTALHKSLTDQGTDIRMSTPCTGIERDGSDGLLVHTEAGTLQADVVVAAINAGTLATLLGPEFGSVSEKLASLPICDVATVTLEYPSSCRAAVPPAFGHLIPSSEDEENLGVIYDSVVFPEHDREDKSTVRLTVMIGGAWFNEILGSNPTASAVEDIAMRSVRRQLGITAEPVNMVTNIIRDAIPQYPVGHPETILGIDQQLRDDGVPLTLIGPSYESPGANHCIHNAKVQAKALLDQWDIIDYQNSAVESAAS